MNRPPPATRRGLRTVALLAVLMMLAVPSVTGCSSGGATRRTDAPRPSTARSSAGPTSDALTSNAPTSNARTSDPASSSVRRPGTSPSAAALTPTPVTSGAEPLVVLDPGHNGGNAAHVSRIDRLVYAGYGEDKPCNTTGTETDAGYPEHAFTWDVSNRVRAILQAHGVRVRLTRDSDTGVGPCVDERARLESAKGVTLSVAIHADGAPAAGHGFHVNEDGRRPEGASAATVARTGLLCRDLHAALASTSGLVPSTYIGTNGYYLRTDLAGLNLTTTPTSFLELGNMRNAHDAALQSSATGRQQIAAAVAAGILAYLAR